MTDRERWIVYPLLFLALGAALRDKIDKRTQAKQIVCEQLCLVDAEGRLAAVLTDAGIEFTRGTGLIRAERIEANRLLQAGRPAVTIAPPAGISLEQLLQMIPQLQLTPGPPQPAPQSAPAPQPLLQDPAAGGEVPDEGPGESPEETPTESPAEPAPAA